MISGEHNLSGLTEFAEYLYIGPDADITINSDWVISSRFIFISPTAKITGNGMMIIDDPQNFGAAGESVTRTGKLTTIDGGNATILAPVLIRNPNNVAVGPVSISESAGAITTPNLNHTLYIGSKLVFADTHADGSVVNNNHLKLTDYDLKIAGPAVITHYDSNSFVITAGSGHLLKEAYTGTFIFPIGINNNDYTPAGITSMAINSIHVNVTDYNTAPSTVYLGKPENGMNRLWNIYGDGTGGAIICLQHNTITNGATYDDNNNFVTQYGIYPNVTGNNSSNSPWQSNTPSAGSTGYFTDPVNAVTGSSSQCRLCPFLATNPSSNEAYFTKSSDVSEPLSIAAENFKGTVPDCDHIELTWNSLYETNGDHFVIEQSTDNINFIKVGAVAAKGVAAAYIYKLKQGPGTYYYRLQMLHSNGLLSTISTIQLVNTCPLKEKFEVMPNPADDASEVVLRYTTLNNGPAVIWFTDQLGRRYTQKNITVTGGANTYRLGAQFLAAGIYFVKITGTDGKWSSETKKLVVLH